MSKDDANRWFHTVKEGVEANLKEFFARETATAQRFGPEATELISAIEEFTLRGGKRLRPAVLSAAYLACREEGSLQDVFNHGAALELLQTYLLIHDDWMDQDEERRGGPTVHVIFQKRLGDTHLGASVAILAGDLAASYAWQLLCAEDDRSAAQRARIHEVYARLNREVIFGQHLDLIASPNVSLMQQLKTGSYTLWGPLMLGAALGDANEEQTRSLEAFGRPLGEAFQLRDDWLGAFGDPVRLGKPVGNDLRVGKRTSLIRAAEEMFQEHERTPLTRVFGVAEATDSEIALATEWLSTAGARAKVEAQLEQLVSEAHAALDQTSFSDRGRHMLTELANLLTQREK